MISTFIITLVLVITVNTRYAHIPGIHSFGSGELRTLPLGGLLFGNNTRDFSVENTLSEVWKRK
jgi:hypothetical protein